MIIPILKYGAIAISALAPIAMKLWNEQSEKNKFIEDRLYTGYMNGEFTEDEVRAKCKEYGIDFPPRSSSMKAINVKDHS